MFLDCLRRHWKFMCNIGHFKDKVIILILIFFSYYNFRSLQTVPNLFIFSLSCSDIMVCLTSGTITPITALRKNWIFGQFLCSVAPFLAGTSLSFSTFTLAAISIDRFLLIRFPMKKPFTHYQAFLIICIIIIMAIGLCKFRIYLK